MLLIDTNIFIYYLNNDKIAIDYFNSLVKSELDVYYSFINKIELLGLPDINEQEEILIRNMLSEFNKIIYDENIEEKTIEIKNKVNIKIPAAIIAASALVNDCTLVTRNLSDFNNIPGLALFNPYDK